ncbi:MAG TPA: TOBE domain-containing protein [Fibrobacteria bacterium]|nr:TOBE domain-containing protein [Fibrobacteria bacterium]
MLSAMATPDKTRAKTGAKPSKKQPMRSGPLLVPSWQLSGTGGIRLGEEYVDLLKAIQLNGSLREAATVCGISYRTAWARACELNNLARDPLVISATGGARGGESVLSLAGQRLLTVQERASALFEQAMKKAGIDPEDLDSLFDFLKRISMRTTARNQFHAAVTAIRKGPVEAEVEARLRGGATVTSRVTLGGLEGIGTREGGEVVVIVKANWIRLEGGSEMPRTDGNRLHGRIVGIHPAPESTEVELELDGGEHLVSTIPSITVKSMRLSRGGQAWAVFQPSSVILGTLG